MTNEGMMAVTVNGIIDGHSQMEEVTIVVPEGSRLEVVGPARVRIVPLAPAAIETVASDRPSLVSGSPVDATETSRVDDREAMSLPPPSRLERCPAATARGADDHRHGDEMLDDDVPLSLTDARSSDGLDPATNRAILLDDSLQPSSERQATPPAAPTTIDHPAYTNGDDKRGRVRFDDGDARDIADDTDGNNETVIVRRRPMAGRPLHTALRDGAALEFERELATIRGRMVTLSGGDATTLGPSLQRSERPSRVIAADDADDDETIPPAKVGGRPERGGGFRVINGDGDEMWVYGSIDWCHAMLDALAKAWDPRRVWFDNKGTFDALLLQASGNEAKQLARVRAEAERQIRIALKAQR